MTVVAAPKTLTTGHVGLNVTDLERSVGFYTQVFGFEVAGRSDEPGRAHAFLALDGRLMLTLWQQSDGRFPLGLAGLHHLSFQVETLDEVRAMETTLREAGAELVHEGIVAHAEGASSGGLFFLDPDGIRLEVYTPAGVAEAPAPSGAAPTCGFF